MCSVYMMAFQAQFIISVFDMWYILFRVQGCRVYHSSHLGRVQPGQEKLRITKASCRIIQCLFVFNKHILEVDFQGITSKGNQQNLRSKSASVMSGKFCSEFTSQCLSFFFCPVPKITIGLIKCHRSVLSISFCSFTCSVISIQSFHKPVERL